MKKFIISDLHLNHTNIIKYCHRPFKNTEEMNRTIITNWNNTVKKDDIVYFLGDFCCGNRDVIKSFREKLNGHIIIITGNHDRGPKTCLALGFDEAYKELTLDIAGHQILLTHRPKLGYTGVNIHGHLHNLSMKEPNYYNVSVEHLNYTPIDLDELLERIKKDQKWD